MNTIPTRFLDRLVAGAIEPSDAREATGGAFDLLVLSGGPGTGKTLAACEWLRPKTSIGHGGWFVTAALLARYPRYDAKAMHDLLTCRALVVDDLGCEYMDDKGNFMAVLDEVINARYGERLPTLITTNLNADAFKERYGSRIADRIREDGRFVALGDVSFRPRMAGGESEAIRGAAAKAADEAAKAKEAATAMDWSRITPWPKKESSQIADVVRELAVAKAVG